jgi:hypothetical protein
MPKLASADIYAALFLKGANEINPKRAVSTTGT